jgi:hypothetical protein
MSYKPDEALLIAYLYNELDGEERKRVEQYLTENTDVKKQLEHLRFVQSALGNVTDKEVIAPPIVLDEYKQSFWHSAYFKTVISIAASLLILILVGKAVGLQMSYGNNELRISFGEVTKPEEQLPKQLLTPQQVQYMIDASMQQNNLAIQTNLSKSQQQYEESLRKVMTGSSGKMDQLVRQVSAASEEQIRQYVLTMQSENAQIMKDYMQLTSNEQKEYIEDLLVDFSKYMQQQRTNDLMVLQARMNTIEQNTDLFKQETEQILTSIITNADNTANKTVKY